MSMHFIDCQFTTCHRTQKSNMLTPFGELTVLQILSKYWQKIGDFSKNNWPSTVLSIIDRAVFMSCYRVLE